MPHTASPRYARIRILNNTGQILNETIVPTGGEARKTLTKWGDVARAAHPGSHVTSEPVTGPHNPRLITATGIIIET